MQREVVRWLQSLDLSFPVKNPKRDLANGFTVAEILSRYDKEVAMHSFDTGLAMTRRLDNWAQIQKIFARMECKSITKDLVEGTLQGKGEAAGKLLDELYMFLTKRPLRENLIAPVKPTALDLPGYARPTAAILLREANDPSTLRLQQATGQIDEEKIRLKNEALLQQHTATLQTLKIAEPERYIPDVPQVKPKTVRSGSQEAKPGHSKPKMATERAVASVPSAVLQQFAQRESALKEEALRAGFPPTEDLSTALSRVLHRAIKDYGLVDLLDSVADVPSSIDSPDAGNYFGKFATLRTVIPTDAKNACWSLLLSSSRNIAKHLKTRPKEIHHLFVALSYCFSKEATQLKGFELFFPESAVHKYSAQHQALDSVLDVANGLQLLLSIGHECTAISTELSGLLIEQYFIPRVALSLSTGSTTYVDAIGKVLAGFVHATHSEGLQRLLSGLETVGKAVSPDRYFCLIHGIFTAVSFTECPGSAALCVYFAISALNNESKLAQGYGLLLLRKIVDVEVRSAATEIPQVLALASESGNWEVRLAALEVLCAFHEAVVSSPAFLHLEAAADFDTKAADGESDFFTTAARDLLPRIEDAVVLSLSTFSLSPVSQRKLSLYPVARHRLDKMKPEVANAFFARLSSELSNEERRTLLCFAEDQDVAEGVEGRLRAVYPIGGLFSIWKSQAVLQALASEGGAANVPTLQLLDLMYRTLRSMLDAKYLPISTITSNKQLLCSMIGKLAKVPHECVADPSSVECAAEDDVETIVDLSKRIVVLLYSELAGDKNTSSSSGAYDDHDDEALLQMANEWISLQVDSM